MIRFVHFFGYTSGVSIDEGEAGIGSNMCPRSARCRV